jgi:hypothetical protein
MRVEKATLVVKPDNWRRECCIERAGVHGAIYVQLFNLGSIPCGEDVDQLMVCTEQYMYSLSSPKEGTLDGARSSLG